MKHNRERGLGPVKNNELQVFGILIAALQSLPAGLYFAVRSTLSPNYSGILIRDAKLHGICLLWKWSAKQPFVWALKRPFHIQREFCTLGEAELECWLFTGTSNCRDLFCNVQFSILDAMLTGARIITYNMLRISLSHHGHHSRTRGRFLFSPIYILIVFVFEFSLYF